MNKLLIAVGRISLGIVFIISAVTKLLSSDEFELYIFSLQYFNFNLSTLAARFVISFELFLGFMFILNLKFKMIYRLSIGTMIVFSLFLLIQFLQGNTENCNCFGETLKMDPLESLIKNIVMLGVLVLIRNNQEWKIKIANKLTGIAILIFLFIPSIISPPDFLVSHRYDRLYSVEDNEVVQLKETSLAYNEGRKVLVFIIPNCRSCRHTAKKLSTIAESSNNTQNVYLLFAGNQDEQTIDRIKAFYSDNNVSDFAYDIIHFEEAIRIASGLFPTIIFTEDGKVISKYGYRNIPEREFYKFFE